MAYSTDADLLNVRSTIMSLGVDDWSDFHDTAKTKIDQDLEVKWYRNAAPSAGYDWRFTPFDATLLTNAATQLLDLSCYKTLFLIYRYLAQDTTMEQDAYGQQRAYWEHEYDLELERVIERGLDYDWDSSAAIDTWEKSHERTGRRVKRV
jgi:hypothetical protein